MKQNIPEIITAKAECCQKLIGQSKAFQFGQEIFSANQFLFPI
jgi:hypothetical protein